MELGTATDAGWVGTVVVVVVVAGGSVVVVVAGGSVVVVVDGWSVVVVVVGAVVVVEGGSVVVVVVGAVVTLLAWHDDMITANTAIPTSASVLRIEPVGCRCMVLVSTGLDRRVPLAGHFENELRAACATRACGDFETEGAGRRAGGALRAFAFRRGQ
jgi:hypothetical protein